MNTAAIIWAILTILLIAAAFGTLAWRRKKAASSAVNAECLVCAYLETCEDATAARSAAEGHAAETGHVLMLVFAGPVSVRG